MSCGPVSTCSLNEALHLPLRRAARRLPGAGGTYLNFLGDAPTDSAIVRAQFGANLERLTEVKRKYDPSNMFRVNNNIRP